MKLKGSLILTVIALSIAGIFVLSFVKSADMQIKIAKETNVYNRTQACILSVPPVGRTTEYIAGCYNEAEKHNGVKVKRFGNIKGDQ